MHEYYRAQPPIAVDDSLGNADYEKLSLAIREVADDLAASRAEILQASLETGTLLGREEYERTREENNRRIAGLEEELSLLRNKIQDVDNIENSNDNPTDFQEEQAPIDISSSTIIRDTVTIVLNKDNPAATEPYQRRISDLEKELTQLRKKLKKAEREPYIRNPSRSEPSSNPPTENKKESTSVDVPPPTVIRDTILKENTIRDTVTIVLDKNNPEAMQEYQRRISDLEGQLQQARADNLAEIASKSTEIELLKKQLQEVEQRLATQATVSPAAAADYAALLAKVEMISQQLTENQRELQALKNQTPPPPSTTTIIKTEPAPTPPAPDFAKEAVARIGVTTVFFNTGKSSISTRHINDLDKVAALMNQYPSITARVVGFADKSGNPEANLILSRKRSEAVAAFLQSRGISSSRIRVTYQGASQSTSPNDPYARRVEVLLSTY